jgi:hypothetical protein
MEQPVADEKEPNMEMTWTKYQTLEQTERAIERLEFAGFERDRVDRIEGQDGRWTIGVYADENELAQVRKIMHDPNAPAGSDLRNSLLIFGVAALAGILAGSLLSRRLRSNVVAP